MSLRVLLLPFSFLYGMVVRTRNLLFDVGILKSKSFSLPLIVVGNLTTGGTGKTPHVIYLVNLLKHRFKVATLSRGYGRKSTGFHFANDKTTTADIGDEPMLYRQRFENSVMVGVGEKRADAIEIIKRKLPGLQVIVLDDAFQHRYVKAGLNIVLTEYHNPYFNDYLLPAGNLREPATGISRADIIIVTKCPGDISRVVMKTYLDKINPRSNQQVFFSGLQYGDLVSLKNEPSKSISAIKDYEVILVTGIANPKPLTQFLDSVCKKVFSFTFKDHHQFTHEDLVFIERNFNTIAAVKKIIITTEKDSMRLHEPSLASQISHLPVYYLPAEVYFINNQQAFDQHILNYVTKN